MANRMISYGYGVDGDNVCVIGREAETVKFIFEKYNNGTKLEDIAKELTNRAIEYFQGNSLWNKNRVCRIIENQKYIGKDDYPAIVDYQTFEKANSIKNEKGAKKQRQADEVEYLKKNLFCSQCGRVLTRRLKWRTREKWLCSNGCKEDVYLDDKHIYSELGKIILSIKEDENILGKTPNSNIFNTSIEVVQHRNALRNLMDNEDINFNQCKKIILKVASLKFDLCEENKQETHNEIILKEVEEYVKTNAITKEMMDALFSKITINKDGTITVVLTNGKELTSQQEEKNGRSSKQENNNENRCKSFVVETESGEFNSKGCSLLSCVNG